MSNKYLEKIAALDRSPLNLVTRLGQVQRATSKRMIGRATGATDKKFPVKALSKATGLKNAILNKVTDVIHI